MNGAAAPGGSSDGSDFGWFMQHVVIVIHLMLVLALIGVVLLQRSEGGGLGIGGGGGFMTSRGTANVLTRATAVLAGLFFLTSMVLSILAGLNRAPSSIIQAPSAPSTPAPTTPAPLGPGGGGLLKQLQEGAPPRPGAPPPAPAAPAAPSGPAVPQSK
jgi:preprotein translocase subunit SecG